MRQERKRREDDDTHSVISEARSQRSMVIGGSMDSASMVSCKLLSLIFNNIFQRGRRRKTQDDGAGSDAAGSNFGNRAEERVTLLLFYQR